MIAKGATVRQKVPAIEGEVVTRRFNETLNGGKGGMEFRVDWTAADGEKHKRWFGEDELVVTKEPAPTTEPVEGAAQ